MTFKKHQVFEVAPNLTKSKQLVSDIFENDQYVYRAKATLIGNCNVEPYDLIYLGGLDGGLSGHWTVLSVTHVFGTGAPYLLEVEIGANVLGQSFGISGTPYRDVELELSGAAPAVSTSVLSQAGFTADLSEEEPGVVAPTVVSASFLEGTAPTFSSEGSMWRSS